MLTTESIIKIIQHETGKPCSSTEQSENLDARLRVHEIDCLRREVELLRKAVRRYGDRSRMATAEPMELQQAIDRAMSESNGQ